MKNILLSLALFALVILLLLPPLLRLFGKNLYADKKNNNIQDEYEMLKCSKINETISVSFVNGKTYNIKYEISGNHAVDESINEEVIDSKELPDETENLEEEKIPVNSLIEDFKDYAEIKYKEDTNLTEFIISMNKFDTTPEKLSNHAKTIDEVKNYYSELSFSCTTQKL